MSGADARLFLAVAVPPDAAWVVREEARARLDGCGSWRVLPARGLHLTVRFLGDTAPDVVGALIGGFPEAARDIPAHALELETFGVFPSPRRPRVFWTGPRGDAPATRSLADAADRWLGARGFPARERAFRPHVTLARARPGALAPAPGGRDGTFRIRVPVDRLTLYRSRLGDGPPRYEPLSACVLGGGETIGRAAGGAESAG